MTETDDNKIAVVIAVNDQAQELEEHLEKFLNLPFNGHYRVIVVDEAFAGTFRHGFFKMDFRDSELRGSPRPPSKN